MNTILDVLYLRRPRIEYVSPPVCETIFSGSGGPVIILEPLTGLSSPTGLRLSGRGLNRFLVWNVYPGQICYTVYFQANPGDPFSAISECVPPNSVALCQEGFYKVSVNLQNGTTTGLSDAFAASGFGYSFMPLPQFPDTQSYNVFRSDTIDGVYTEILSDVYGNIFQTCQPGCYAVSAITLEGETPLSTPVCTGGCQVIPCPPGFGFNLAVCDCVPCDQFPPPDCDTGFFWSAEQCKCVAAGPSGPTIQFNFCKDVADGKTFIAPGGFAAPCVFSLVGDLPPGVVFTQDSPLSASISGTATAYGTYNFVVEINDAGNQFSEQAYQLFVEGINSGTPPSLTIGVPYSFQFTATGGVPPYVWQIGGAGWPIPGMSFDTVTGILSGTPTTPGNYFIDVTETDALNYTSCDVTYTLNASSTCPVWSNIVWNGAADLLIQADPGNSASASFSGASFQVQSGCFGGGTALVRQGSGSLFYNGPGCNCNISGVMTKSIARGGVNIIWQPTNTVLAHVLNTDFPDGTHAFSVNFTVPAGPGTIIIQGGYDGLPPFHYWTLSQGGFTFFDLLMVTITNV